MLKNLFDYALVWKEKIFSFVQCCNDVFLVRLFLCIPQTVSIALMSLGNNFSVRMSLWNRIV